jgi:hypothetical protein
VPVQRPSPAAALELEPDANRTREELHRLLERQAPSLRKVLALDPSLLGNDAYLAPYPGLSAFLAAHPDIARNPSFYLGEYHEQPRQQADRVMDISKDILGGLAAFIGVGMAIGLITWLIRTLIDYRRWSRLSKVQAEVHTKILDRFNSSDELAAYIQSPAGAKFLESSPIKLDPGPRSMGAPMGRILWSIQGGVVLLCAGLGLLFISYRLDAEAAQAMHSFGILALALGAGFAISAIISYGVARRLGLIEPIRQSASSGPAGA